MANINSKLSNTQDYELTSQGLTRRYGRVRDFLFFHVSTCADLSVPVFPLCTSYALKDHCAIREDLMADCMETHKRCKIVEE